MIGEKTMQGECVDLRGGALDAQLEHQFLEAAAELVLRQGELLPRVEAALGLDPYEHWITCSHGPPTDSDPESVLLKWAG